MNAPGNGPNWLAHSLLAMVVLSLSIGMRKAEAMIYYVA